MSGTEEKVMEKKNWIEPEVTDIDIADGTEFDPVSGADAGANLGLDPNGGGGGGGS
jgi:hypothetical protein